MDEQAAVLAVVNAGGGVWEWHRIADALSDAGSALRVIDGGWSGFEKAETRMLHPIVRHAAGDIPRYTELLAEQRNLGVRCVTVLDREYPANLRAIHNRPPFLFVKGAMSSDDDKAIAIVGTRMASPEGLDQAARLASSLSRAGVTVISGMARGIDTAAHTATLRAGGRTVAVMGTGISRRYPAENASLADEIEASGALISQFWPDSPPTRFSFPMRNVVMSGMAVGTVVIEASSTSGAKMQARLALEHGKLVFLVRSLVLGEAWAKAYVDQRGAIVVDHVDEVLGRLAATTDARDSGQLRLA